MKEVEKYIHLRREQLASLDIETIIAIDEQCLQRAFKQYQFAMKKQTEDNKNDASQYKPPVFWLSDDFKL